MHLSELAIMSSRGSVWSNAEVKALIAVWGEGNVQEELENSVWERIIVTAVMYFRLEVPFLLISVECL